MSEPTYLKALIKNETAFAKFLAITVNTARPNSPALEKASSSLTKMKQYLSQTVEDSDPSLEDLDALATLLDILLELENTIKIKQSL